MTSSLYENHCNYSNVTQVTQETVNITGNVT